MQDPMAGILESESNPYGNSATKGILTQLFRSIPPEVMAEATGTLLNRLTVIEMYLEEVSGIEIQAEDLEKFIQRRLPDIEKETEKLANLFFGSISRREGG